MLVIRFSRVGKRNHAQFRVVVAEKSAPIKGRFVELLGSYDPHLKQASLKEDRISHWISQGAQPTDSVWNLLIKEGVVKGDKRTVVLTPKKGEEGEEGDEEKKEGKKEDAPKDADAKDEAPKEKVKAPEAEEKKEEKTEEKAEGDKKEKKPAEEKKEEAPKKE